MFLHAWQPRETKRSQTGKLRSNEQLPDMGVSVLSVKQGRMAEEKSNKLLAKKPPSSDWHEGLWVARVWEGEARVTGDRTKLKY